MKPSAPLLVDDVLRAALAADADAPAPTGLLREIGAAVRSTPQARRRTWAGVFVLGRPADLAAPWAARHPFAAVALVAAALALAAGAAVGAGLLLRDHRLPLRPTAIEVLTPGVPAPADVVADGLGVHWGLGSDHLTRFDPATGERRTWTVADDPIFGAWWMYPAAAGGVWLRNGTELRWFDGTAFAAAVELPAEFGTAWVGNAAVDVSPDGAVWAASPDRGLEHWDGEAWVAAPAGLPAPYVASLLAVSADEVWVATTRDENGVSPPPVAAGVSHLVAGRWTSYDVRDNLVLGGVLSGMERAADGSIWVSRWGILTATADHPAASVARFDGTTWTTLQGPDAQVTSLVPGPDGSMWATLAGPAAPPVARYADGSWTVTRIPATDPAGTYGTLSVTPAAAWLRSDAGLFRNSDGAWTLVWPYVTGPSIDSAVQLVAASATEAWAAVGSTLWHLEGSTWTPSDLPSVAGASGEATGLAMDRRGWLWLTARDGVFVRRDGTWSKAWRGQASSVAFDADGAAWVATDERRLVRITADGSGFKAASHWCDVTGVGIGVGDGTRVAVAGDGSVYVAGQSLVLLDGAECRAIQPVDDQLTGKVDAVLDLLADASGRVLVAVIDYGPQGALDAWSDRSRTTALVRLDGDDGTVLARQTVAPGDWWASLALGPDGSAWEALGEARQVARLDEDGRIVGTLPAPIRGPMAFAPDGTLYATTNAGLVRVPARVVTDLLATPAP